MRLSKDFPQKKFFGFFDFFVFIAKSWEKFATKLSMLTNNGESKALQVISWRKEIFEGGKRKKSHVDSVENQTDE